MARIPYGAIAMWTNLDRLGAGLQQLMAGARKFAVDAISRDDIASANRETERETGVPFITDAQDEAAVVSCWGKNSSKSERAEDVFSHPRPLAPLRLPYLSSFTVWIRRPC